MQFSKRDFEQGRANAELSLGLNRRDFLRASVAVPAGLGAAYFGYKELRGEPVRAAIIGTGNEGCDAMIMQSPPGYLRYVGYHDIRPSQIARAGKRFVDLYGPRDGAKVKFYEKRQDLINDPEVEVVVIATPLWTHAQFTIEALNAGKHVFCEKLMAHNIAEAKAMIKAAERSRRLLAVGHQRHYSTLYADAVATIESGALGDIHHIRAFWHRNNTLKDPKTGEVIDGWKPAIPDADKEAVASGALDPKQYGYKSLEELVRWRLYNRTGGGLMAELGSHQLDACSIFVGKDLHPISVSGFGGKHYYTDERECEDHVYCSMEFPKGVVVTYSSINTNAMEGYGEVVMGTRGTMMVLRERDVLLFNENDPLAKKREARAIEEIQGAAKKGESTMYSAASLGLPAQAAKASTGLAVSRGYKEELEHFAYCVRNPDHEHRCPGKVALADAVMALTANVAMRTGQRIEFKDGWFDPDSPEVPDGAMAAADVKA